MRFESAPTIPCEPASRRTRHNPHWTWWSSATSSVPRASDSRSFWKNELSRSSADRSRRFSSIIRWTAPATSEFQKPFIRRRAPRCPWPRLLELLGGNSAFWQAHDYLYKHRDALAQGKLTPDAVAAALQLDPARFREAMTSQAVATRVARGYRSSQTLRHQGDSRGVC